MCVCVCGLHVYRPELCSLCRFLNQNDSDSDSKNSAGCKTPDRFVPRHRRSGNYREFQFLGSRVVGKVGMIHSGRHDGTAWFGGGVSLGREIKMGCKC